MLASSSCSKIIYTIFSLLPQLHYATRIGREEGERIGREEGERIGREEGERIGKEEGKSEMIRSMWKAGVSEEQIASIAQKTVEEVRKLCK